MFFEIWLINFLISLMILFKNIEFFDIYIFLVL